jgi:crotonobetainyl-CoA:carnitine CoA-transferase CaiB-like acyl-CoA transferase
VSKETEAWRTAAPVRGAEADQQPQSTHGRGLLDGMRVFDAGIWRPVPHATQLLADLGADVLKLEPPGGDPMRTFPDIFRDVASHKGSVMLDLRSDAGRARALELAARADVFCEGWRPGVADRLGVGYEHVKAVNPSIIYCSVSGYGQTGELTALPGHDVNYQALAGAIARANSTEHPAIPRVPIADLAAATVAALAICAAWANRLRTGEGERIDVAMADVVASWIGPRSGNAIEGRDEATRGSTGYGVFRCADGGWLALGVIAEDHFWRAVCEGLGIAELGALRYFDRLDRFEECQAAVVAACAALPRDVAIDRLTNAGAPVTPVLTPEEMGAHPHFRERGVIAVDERAELRVSFPAVFSNHPGRAPGPNPDLDADSSAWSDPRD